MEKGLFNQRVYEVVRRIPKGKVATYGQVAALAGAPRNARFVGYALHSNPEPDVIPCHRVVFRDGSLAPGFAFGGPERQRLLLEEEGVAFISPKGMSELSESGEMKGSTPELPDCASISPVVSGTPSRFRSVSTAYIQLSLNAICFIRRGRIMGACHKVKRATGTQMAERQGIGQRDAPGARSVGMSVVSLTPAP